MANPLQGETKLGDFTLAFTFGAFIALEERVGKKVPQLLQMMQDGLGFADIRDFAWAGLLKHHPELTDAEISAILDDVGFEVAGGAIGKAVSNFFARQKEKAKNPPKAA